MYRRLVAVLVAAVATTACGGGGEATADRTVDVQLKDVAFVPSTLSVRKGETVTFRFTNADTVEHDAFVGDEAAQNEHEQDMRGGHGDHGDDAVTVPAGQTKTLTYTFGKAGTTYIGCHVSGHYAAGMRMTITVD